MSCGNPGRCCNGPDCSTNVGACKCRCNGTDWSAENLCTEGACWISTDAEYSCIQTNPCDCIYRGGEFSGSGTSCPEDGSGPPPPPPPAPPPEDPGPVIVYCCNNDWGTCSPSQGYCAPGQTLYWSSVTCDARCYAFGPPPPDPPDPPDPVGPCDPPCGPCQDCVNGACVDRCPPSQCCNGVCCAAGQTCVNGTCVTTCSRPCSYYLIPNSAIGLVWSIRSSCEGGCTCLPPSRPPTNEDSYNGTILPSGCVPNAFP
jgi:hypothetical protein